MRAALVGALVGACLGQSNVVNVDWSNEVRKLATTPALQVVVNPLIMRDSPVDQQIFQSLKQLGANYVRFVPWLPYPRLGVAELEPPSGNNLCGFRASNTTEFPVTLSCNGNGVISSVDTVVYGEYSGYCGGITPGACNSAKAADVVKAACMGKASCTIIPSNDFFGGDPCPGKNKGLAVQVQCSSPGNFTYWDFSQLDPLMEDFMNATQGQGHSVIINFSTPPQWLYAGDRVSYPDDPHEVFWSYEQGNALVDPTATQLGDYYGRLLAWYTDGGFTDEAGVFHSSGHTYNISIWECLNEVDGEHGLSPQEYVTQYDAMVAGMRRHAPKGTASMQWMGMALESFTPDFIAYWLNASNHAANTPRDWFSWHHYASCSNRSDPATYEQFFDSVDATTPLVATALQLRDTISPTTKMDLDELGVILPNDNSAIYTRNDPGFPLVYWNAAAAYYAYLFAQWSLLGVDVLGESQFVGYPQLDDLNLAPQYPSVAMVNWTTGEGTARYWVLKLLLDELSTGQTMPNTTVAAPAAPASNPFCGSIINLSNLTLTCTSPGAVISNIQFASYGTPTGTCGSYAVDPTCNAANSMSVVKSYCLGQQTCTVPATTPIFGDPCYGTVKHLVVQATCSQGGGVQPPSGGAPVAAQAFVDPTSAATRKVLLVNKQHTANNVTLPGATGGTWLYVDETTGFGPYQSTPIVSDTWVLGPFAAGIAIMP